MKKVKHIYSNGVDLWKEGVTGNDQYEDTLEVTHERKQVVKGFGGCFNEAGWEILKNLNNDVRNNILDDLFNESGCAFNVGRLPMGASDYALEWHSYDETPGDYELKNFSITRDKEYLLPYLKEAIKRSPEMALFASPWSPPTWMKTKRAYNFGKLIWEEKNLKAYANYFIKYLESYQNEGIKVEQVHVQNEPVADQKFPSCIWTGKELRDFIKHYLGPLMKKKGMNTELWLGTINGPFFDFMLEGCAPFSEFYDQFVNTVLADKEARKYISGVGFQWGGKHVIEQAELSYPELRFMQTENECGDGNNTWEHAEYVYGLFWQFFQHGVESYVYWNMVLPEGGVSTWGWKQNSLITIDAETKKVIYQPEYYVMKHFSHFIKKGAKKVVTKGHWTSNSVVFENPNGDLVVIVGNAMDTDREFTFKCDGESFSTVIKQHSINTFCVSI
ncbi:glycoside hydrolase family 30 protein [Clostridium estertheticum]|uniref:Glycosyl hydrolase n=1 Tax=Clostridium estertheticum TaxID=238834 RepID=A0AA47EG17_9CLOT|nr:glycoside hydrolase family 30 protein [Clostridium estertheticum]MBU3154953.1 glycosyl hydrolase [Clostridium estertheticum]WAG58774.1 glycosyl hydrolase [Clostridium estertheticum]